MEVKEEDKTNNLLCNACLCVGRKLYKIAEAQTRKYYLDILSEVPLCNINTICLNICWECRALLKRSIAFRTQVQDSYRILQTYTQENLQEHLLSEVSWEPTLKVNTLESISISPTQEPEDSTNSYVTEVKIVPVKGEPDGWESGKNTQDSAAGNEMGVKDEPFKGELEVEWDCSKDDTNHLEEDYETDSSVQYESEVRNMIKSIKRDGNKSCSKQEGVRSKIKRAKKIVKKLKLEKKPKRTKVDDKIITVMLSYEEMMSEREREAVRECYLSSEYRCESCLVAFSYSKAYLAHVAAKHAPELGDYECPICKTVISSVDSFTVHYKRHMRRYECSICGKRTLDKKVLQQHYYSTHEISLKQYRCELCGYISNSIDTHRYHKDTHKARIQCPECDKTFRHRAGLMNHRLAVHELHNAFPCPVCEKVFRWKTSLKRHLEKHEVKGAPPSAAAYCGACDVSFASLSSYQRHMKNSLKHVSQDQLRFTCDHCGKRFADKTKLRDHIEEKHLHKSYQCHICLKPSKNRVGLDQHIRNVHRGRPNNKMCHHCGKAFPTKMQLESHIRTHTGERPFICEYCPTTFSQQSNLYKHNRQVHLNKKSKRYMMCKKRKDDKPTELPAIDNALDVYRPAMLHYSPERGFIM